MKAFHVFVAIHTKKNPHEVSSLMAYAQIIRKLAESCGDQAAINHDEIFRKWRQQDPSACQWHPKNVELFQDAIIKGMNNKMQSNKQQPFRRKHKYCYSFNNHGSCKDGNSCPHTHVCQYCPGKHPRKQCQKSRRLDQRQQSTKDASKPTFTTPTNHNTEIVTSINVPQFSKYIYGYQFDLQSFLIE